MKLLVDEQDVIDRSEQDGNDWALPDGVSAGLRERLALKGMVRYWANRWQLTPAGFERSRMFR